MSATAQNAAGYEAEVAGSTQEPCVIAEPSPPGSKEGMKSSSIKQGIFYSISRIQTEEWRRLVKADLAFSTEAADKQGGVMCLLSKQ